MSARRSFFGVSQQTITGKVKLSFSVLNPTKSSWVLQSSQDFLDYSYSNVSQFLKATSMKVAQSPLAQAHHTQESRMHIIYGGRIFGAAQLEFVSLAKRCPTIKSLT